MATTQIFLQGFRGEKWTVWVDLETATIETLKAAVVAREQSREASHSNKEDKEVIPYGNRLRFMTGRKTISIASKAVDLYRC